MNCSRSWRIPPHPAFHFCCLAKGHTGRCSIFGAAQNYIEAPPDAVFFEDDLAYQSELNKLWEAERAKEAKKKSKIAP